MLRSRRGQETEKQVLEAKVKIQKDKDWGIPEACLKSSSKYCCLHIYTILTMFNVYQSTNILNRHIDRAAAKLCASLKPLQAQKWKAQLMPVMNSGSQVRRPLEKKRSLFNGEILKISEITAPNKVTDSTVFLLHLGGWEWGLLVAICKEHTTSRWVEGASESPELPYWFTYQTWCLILPSSQGNSF